MQHPTRRVRIQQHVVVEGDAETGGAYLCSIIAGEPGQL